MYQVFESQFTQMQFVLTSQSIGMEEMEQDVQHQQTTWINNYDVTHVLRPHCIGMEEMEQDAPHHQTTWINNNDVTHVFRPHWNTIIEFQCQ